MIRINLLPIKAAQKKEKLIGQLIVLGLALVVAVALCGGAYVHITGKVQSKQQSIDTKRAEIAKLQKTIGEVNSFKKRQQDLRAKLDILEQLKEARTGPVYWLDELEKAMPEKVWLTNFKEKVGTISIKGMSVNEEDVAVFMRNLDASEYFTNVLLKVTQLKITKDIRLQQFDITFNVVNKKADAATSGPAKNK